MLQKEDLKNDKQGVTNLTKKDLHKAGDWSPLTLIISFLQKSDDCPQLKKKIYFISYYLV